MRTESIIVLILVSLLIIYVIAQAIMTWKKRASFSLIPFILMKVADWAQILLMIGLVTITAVYAWSTEKMAREMREQRIMASRPIIVQRVMTPIGNLDSDCFEIYNDGNVTAIELEIIQLGKEGNQLAIQKETFFLRTGETPIHFYPVGLREQIGSTCYIVSQYRGILSGETEQIWYQTRLPFVPVKAQSRDYIILQPKELEFREIHKKETF